MTTSPTDRPLRIFSRFYARISERMESEGMAELRSELLAGLSGEVVEVGAGNGLNFGRYPATVTAVTAVEPEPHLRAPPRCRSGWSRDAPNGCRCRT